MEELDAKNLLEREGQKIETNGGVGCQEPAGKRRTEDRDKWRSWMPRTGWKEKDRRQRQMEELDAKKLLEREGQETEPDGGVGCEVPAEEGRSEDRDKWTSW